MRLRRIAAFAVAIGLSSCHSGPQSQIDQGADDATSFAHAPQSMPPLAVRVQRVIDELGPNEPRVRFWVQLDSGKLKRPRRQVLKQLGPDVRASLLRHRVALFHLAATLHGVTP